MPINLPADIQIANSVKPRPIVDVAKDLGLTPAAEGMAVKPNGEIVGLS